MSSVSRYLNNQVAADLQRKMVFISGPRQVGKTTLGRSLIQEGSEGYLNWDIAEHREKILRRELPPANLWMFDEIHKYRRWRNYLKGIYDGKPEDQQILVTGSGRLDLYRYGGDSLQGRYHMLRLYPLSVAELNLDSNQQLLDLLQLGGFPEPWLSGSQTEARRWSRQYRVRLIEEELTALETIKDLGQIQLLLMTLPNRVGSPLSINALREDLQVSHKTATNWLLALERLYALFRLSPFGSPLIRAVKKEQKHYHLDWTLPDEDAIKFENMVACHLLKWVHYKQDTEGLLDWELRYFRDRDSREVDFVIEDKSQPLFLIECKWSDSAIDKSLKYLKDKFPKAEAWQLTAIGAKDYISPQGIRVTPALNFLAQLV